MAVFAMRKGTSPNPTIVTTINDATNNVNFDCPTNPLFVSNAGSSPSNPRLYAYISTDGSHSQNFVQQLQGSDSAGTEYSNLSNTEGYTIHCWDENSQTGLQLDGISPLSNQTYDYFVLLHSDDLLQHHFAKITEIKQDEVSGDRFDFEPRLGKQIPKDTKFMVFRGPLKTETSIVALSIGIKNENITSGSSTYKYDKSYTCARPLFYFYSERLDKENELDHNTKYFIKYIDATPATTITPNINNAFVTTTDFSKRIIDYSKYTMKAVLVDKLRDLDDPTENAITSSEGFTLPSNDFTDYSKCFFNARRDANDVYDQTDASTLALTGPSRYAHYSFSPEKANTNFTLADFNVFESVGSKGGYAEVKLIDTQRILPSKIKKDDLLRIRHRLHSANLSEFFPLKATISSQSGTNFVFNTEYDLSTLLAEGDEVKIADRIYIIASTGSAIGSFSSNQQTIVMTTSTRLESSNIFAATSLTGITNSGDRLFRRAWSQSKGNLLTTFKIIENRHHNVKVIFNDLVEASVSSSNATTKTLSLSFDDSLYESESSIGFIEGAYSIEIERFEGTIEQINTEREFGQNFMKLFGRSTYSKLISPIITKNFLHSKDMIYSSHSPHKLGVFCGTSNTVLFSSNTLTLASVASAPEVGDEIFVYYSNLNFSYAGRVQAYNSSTKVVTLEGKSLATTGKLTLGSSVAHTTFNIYKTNTKPYVFNKALTSNNRLEETTTSLVGASEKGIFFESGLDLSDNSSLIKTSKSTDDKAIGYHLHNVSNIDKDNDFQAELSDGASSPSLANFNTVNSLIDFTVVSQSTKDGKTLIELAPYIPVSLGRLDFNDADSTDLDLELVGQTVGTVTTASERRYIEVTSFGNSPSEGDPIYIRPSISDEGVFVGYITQITKPSTSTNYRIYVDRVVSHGASERVERLDDFSPLSGQNYQEKYTQDLYLVNGEHLHGGKFVSLLHPLFTSNDLPATFNTYTAQRSQSTTTTERYGTPQYRIMHLEKGVFDFTSLAITDIALKFGNFYEGGSKIKYYASCYKVNPIKHFTSSIYYDGTIGRKFTFSNSNHLPIEMRGNFPAGGSLFFDYNVYESGHTKPVIVDVHPPTISEEVKKSKYVSKDYLEQFDAKSRRLFLFSTSDLTPYSKRRTDSLLSTSVLTDKEDLKKYKVMLLTAPVEGATSENQSKYSSNGSAIKYTDENYIDCSISEVDKNPASLKAGAIMRLTEVVFDFAFNQFNPEKPPKKSRSIPSLIYQYHSIAAVTDSGGSNVSVSSYGSSNITLSASVTLSDNDLLVDANGKLIGVVNGNQTGSTITLDEDPIPTNSGSAYTGVLHKATTKKTTIKGHGEKDSFLRFEEGITFHKGTIHNDTYRPESSPFTIFGHALDSPAGTTTHTNSFSNLILPISFNDNDRIGNNISGHPSRLLKKIDALTDNTNSSPDDGFKDSLTGFIFDRYNIESGNRGGFQLSKGTVFPNNDNTHLRKYSNNITTLNMGLSRQFMTHDGPSGGSRTATSSDGEGVFMGFKARIELDTSQSNITREDNVGPGNKSIYFYRITNSEILDFISDLTGCYLVSEAGLEYETGTATGASGSVGGINNTMPNKIGYVLSHEIETDNTTLTHIIQVDSDLTNGFYRVMQPNETTFYDFTPNRIKLNVMSSEYTKVAYENKTYDGMRDYSLAYGTGGRDSPISTNAGNNEAVLSMYVVVDPDKQDSNVTQEKDEVVARNHFFAFTTFNEFPFRNEVDFSACISDGINTHKSPINMKILGTNLGSYLEIGEMKEKHGVVSISETFTITTPQNITNTAKRAMIGSVVNISHEADDIVNDLLESNDIEHEIPDSTYPLFLAPNFKSVDLFSAVNYVLNRKDRDLIFEDSSFKVKESDDADLHPSLFISDRNQKIQIKDFKKSSGLFDFYNEIIVYGASHVSEKRNLRSIQRIGKKTLEVEDPSIFTQEDVDEKAIELLRLHSKLNEKVSVELGHSGLSQLRAGDTISLELVQENVPKNEYQILEMEHRIDGFVKLELGRFSKGMEDRFAELLISTNANRANLRSKELSRPNENASLLDLVSLRERKLMVQKRESSATTNKIGFVRTIGFSAPLSTGTITTTTVREVDF